MISELAEGPAHGKHNVPGSAAPVQTGFAHMFGARKRNRAVAYEDGSNSYLLVLLMPQR